MVLGVSIKILTSIVLKPESEANAVGCQFFLVGQLELALPLPPAGTSSQLLGLNVNGSGLP